jgi:hypothetical protein
MARELASCGIRLEPFPLSLLEPSMNVQEKRHAARRRTLLTGSIRSLDKRSAFDCTVRNLTPQGARLRLPSTIGVPAQFDLLIPSLGQQHRCHIQWAELHELGVAFTPAGDE